MTLGANGYQPLVTSPLMVRSAEGASRTINKYSPDQPRVPAGNGRASGEWTSEGSDWGSPDFAIHGADRTPAPSKPAAPHAGTSSNAAPAHSLLDDGVYRPGADGAPKLTPAQFLEPFLADPSILPPALYARPPVVPPLPEPIEGPLPQVPQDATKPPSPEYEWRGNGPPESGKGAYYNQEAGDSLHPDFNHPGDIAPHWDWIRPDKSEYRWYLDDGRLEQKKGPGGVPVSKLDGAQ